MSSRSFQLVVTVFGCGGTRCKKGVRSRRHHEGSWDLDTCASHTDLKEHVNCMASRLQVAQLSGSGQHPPG